MTTWWTSLQKSPVCFVLCKQANRFEDNVSGNSSFTISLFKDRAICYNVYSFARKSRSKMLIS